MVTHTYPSLFRRPIVAGWGPRKSVGQPVEPPVGLPNGAQDRS